MACFQCGLKEVELKRDFTRKKTFLVSRHPEEIAIFVVISMLNKAKCYSMYYFLCKDNIVGVF